MNVSWHLVLAVQILCWKSSSGIKNTKIGKSYGPNVSWIIGETLHNLQCGFDTKVFKFSAHLGAALSAPFCKRPFACQSQLTLLFLHEEVSNIPVLAWESFHGCWTLLYMAGKTFSQHYMLFFYCFSSLFGFLRTFSSYTFIPEPAAHSQIIHQNTNFRFMLTTHC